MYIIIGIIVIGLLAWFLLGKKKTAALPDKDERALYRNLLNTHVEYYEKLSGPEKLRFEDHIAEFLQEVNIEGVGTEITETDKVLIASSAVIPIFGLGDWRYKNLTNVILYPDTFDQQFQFEGENRNILGMVGSGYMNGQMLLSRAALEKGFSKSPGVENTGIHEFVHLLDNADGATDGVPEVLMAPEYAMPWLKMMHQEMHRVESGKSDISPYALTSEAEFLAVAAEYFFQKPEKFKQMHPDLYAQLAGMFRQ